MADNLTVLDSVAATKIVRTTESGAQIHTPHHNVDAILLPSDLTGKYLAFASAAGNEVMPLAGAPTPLLSGVTVKASLSNAGIIRVGDSNITIAGMMFFELGPGEAVFIEIDDLQTVNIEFTTVGDVASWIGT